MHDRKDCIMPRPCPICGNNIEMRWFDGSDKILYGRYRCARWRVFCPGCNRYYGNDGCVAPTERDKRDSKGTFIMSWNRRVQQVVDFRKMFGFQYEDRIASLLE